MKKIDLKLPNGAELHYTRPEMDRGKFDAICTLIGMAIIALALCWLFR